LAKYFVLISGEDIALAQAEVDSVVRLVDTKAKLEWDNTLGLVETTDDAIQFLLSRSATVKEAGAVITETEPTEDPANWITEERLLPVISSFGTFSIRTQSLFSDRKVEYRKQLTKQIGDKIRNLTELRVSTKFPDVTFLVLLTSNRTLICQATISQTRKVLLSKCPSAKPFFHPSMMNATLARVMCNLAGVMPGNLVCDPFCGSGGILSEIATIGARTIGMDLNWRLIMGSRANLEGDGYGNFTLIQGDARFIPFKTHSFDNIVTDPPYGRVSSTRGAAATRLVRKFLEAVPSILRKGGRLCIGGSSQMRVVGLAEELGLIPKYHIPVRVHRGLVRDIIALEV